MFPRQLVPLLFAVSLLSIAAVHTQAQAIPTRVNLSDSRPQPGDNVEVEVAVDLSGVSDKLGAYGATLKWDADVLKFVETLDGETAAFRGPQTKVSSGELVFSNFSTGGVGGIVSLIKIKLEVIGQVGETGKLELTFSTLDAATTFKNLLPQLQTQAPINIVISNPVNNIVSSLGVSTEEPASGDPVEVEVVVDLSDLSDKLGAYGATLKWDADVLKFVETLDGETTAFRGPQTKVSSGELVFSNFSTGGAGGIVSLVKIKFEVIGQAGKSSKLELTFLTLDAATTFKNLLPQLQVSSTPVVTVVSSNPPPSDESLMPKTGDGSWSIDLNTATGDQQVREKNVAAGQTFTIELIFNQSLINSLGGSWTLQYDSEKVEPLTNTIKGIVSPLGTPKIENNTVSFTLASLSGVSVEQGSIAKISFKTLSGFSDGTEIILIDASTSDGSTFQEFRSSPNASVVIHSSGSIAANPDFNGDGEVGFSDFVLLAQGYGSILGDNRFQPVMDLDGSGDIGFRDFVFFAQYFGKDPSTFGGGGGSGSGSGSGEKEEPPVNVGDLLTVTLSGSTTMDFVYILPGAFTMGSPSSEQGRNSNEGPQHEVTISQGYYLGKVEVTQGQWEAVMGSKPSYYSGTKKPVEQVSWNDVQGFIQKLNDAAGESLYRLPTEAEREYGCRAGTTTRWSFGDDESKLGDYAWYNGNNSPEGPKDVGTKKPNAWGLYDMHGNVWEWCQDWYGDYSSSVQTDPQGPLTGSCRVLRGGSFNHNARNARSAYRNFNSPSSRYSSVGFRLLRRAK